MHDLVNNFIVKNHRKNTSKQYSYTTNFPKSNKRMEEMVLQNNTHKQKNKDEIHINATMVILTNKNMKGKKTTLQIKEEASLCKKG